MSVFGDLEAPRVFEQALRQRAAGTEVILAVTDWKHQRWAHNLLLNLDALQLHHHIVIAAEEEVCHSLSLRMHGELGCGYSSWLRRGVNTTINQGLDAYGIHEGHVYHIWWQRWRYMARAVELGYSALSLDSDLSLRTDPYEILRGPLRHHDLVVAIDSGRSGRQLPRFFPAINVGFVYCRDSPGGAAHRALVEVASRFERMLCGEITPIPSRKATFSQQVLWEQDTFADVIESSAFALSGMEKFRHTISHIARNKRFEDAAMSRDWIRPRFQWLPYTQGSEGNELLLGREGNESGGTQAHSAPSREARLAALPMWYLASYAACPYGNACDGRWARSPTPLGVAHMVGERGKCLLMRLFGWWDYRVDLNSFVSQRDTSRSIRSLKRLSRLQAGGLSDQAKAVALKAQVAVTRVAFPLSVRVLAVRGAAHQLSIGKAGVITPSQLFAAIARWALVALALGRRLVLPMVRCDLRRSRHSLLPKPLNQMASIVLLDDPSLCDSRADSPTWVAPPPSKLRDARPSPNATHDIDERARGAWNIGRGGAAHSQLRQTGEGQRGRRGIRRGCCALVPRASKCVDEFGTRRMLHEELILLERDLSRLKEESELAGESIRWSTSTAASSSSHHESQEEVIRMSSIEESIHTLKATSAPRSSILVKALRSSARILTIDVREYNATLPYTHELQKIALNSEFFKRLAFQGSKNSRGLPHAVGCVQALAGYDALVGG
ncbi:hypothetical protein AB1Y20_004503 [Prymnesium parvum]|uniref:Nucleotide-diphospho-sugar transferase domain-containing protein n=1 Tax=Prymnesium parvum TaxID=97485 RepID=A0AB34IYL2_PRYPA